jgi:hypothetical protein
LDEIAGTPDGSLYARRFRSAYKLCAAFTSSMGLHFASLYTGIPLFALTVWAMAALAAGSPPPTLAPADAALLADAGSFHSLPIVDPIPRTVLACCADADGRLAKPGEPWAATDALPIGQTLPRRRLLWAVQSEQLTAIHYEQGGFAHTYHVALLRHTWWPRDGTLIWQSDTGRFADFAQFSRTQFRSPTSVR